MSTQGTNKAVVLVGAAGSVGETTATSLAADGYDLVLADRISTQDLADQLTGPQTRAYSEIVDLTDEASVAHLGSRVSELVGAPAGVVVVAAVLQGAAPVTELNISEWDRVMNVNLRGPFLVAKHLTPLLPDHDGAAVVNVGSWWGYEGHALFAAYCASKAALRVLTQAMAAELAPRGIRANVVAPGNINGPMHLRALAAEAELRGITEPEMRAIEWAKIPLGAPAEPQDIADAITFLISSSARYITGSVVDVNGGVVFR